MTFFWGQNQSEVKYSSCYHQKNLPHSSANTYSLCTGSQHLLATQELSSHFALLRFIFSHFLDGLFSSAYHKYVKSFHDLKPYSSYRVFLGSPHRKIPLKSYLYLLSLFPDFLFSLESSSRLYQSLHWNCSYQNHQWPPKQIKWSIMKPNFKKYGIVYHVLLEILPPGGF